MIDTHILACILTSCGDEEIAVVVGPDLLKKFPDVLTSCCVLYHAFAINTLTRV